ncbi:hypothetical protein TNCV_5132891 [Trichonephila clavipes]|nr:hypothetical protein TNCV_5132891 [Trichonephila clavipes]
MPRVRSRNAYQHASDFDKGRIIAYRNCGLSHRGLAARVGRDPMTVNPGYGHIRAWRHRGERTLAACIRHLHTDP